MKEDIILGLREERDTCRKKWIEAEEEVEKLKAELARAKEDHQYDNLVHKRELESLKNPIPKLRNKGLM